MSRRLGSVLIPAHNEASVIGRCLDALLIGFEPGELDVVVVCNGCSDETAEIAASYGDPVRVLVMSQPSKPAALRAGDAAAGHPRLYLDADVVLAGAAARRVLERLAAGALAARPPLRYDSSRASAPVRSYYRARSRMPSVLGSLWGAGVYGISEAGRRRFEQFPDVVGDDLWLDQRFGRDEIEIVDCDPVVVTVPSRTRDLLSVLRRTYRGKAEGRGDRTADERARSTTRSAVGDLRRLALSGPRTAADAVTYAALVLGARLSIALSTVLGRSAQAGAWERDHSSRVGAA